MIILVSSSDGHNTWGGEALVDTEERIIVASNHSIALQEVF